MKQKLPFLLLAFLCFNFVQAQYYIQVSSIDQLTGGDTYAENETPRALELPITFCAFGNRQPQYSTVYKISWYRNTSNSTTGGELMSAADVSTLTAVNVPDIKTYLPDTSVPGSYYYYAILSEPSSTGCGMENSLTSTTQKVNVLAPSTHLNLDGVNDGVDLGNSLTTDFVGKNNVTLEAWVKPETTNALGAIVGNHSYPANNDRMQMLLRRDLTTYTFWIDSGSGYTGISTPLNTVALNTWQHVVGTWDGATMKIYVDGVLQKQASNNGSGFPSLSNSFALGYNEVQSINEKFDGSIDEVRIWDVPRSEVQINASKDCELNGTETGLKAYYQFNQGLDGGYNRATTTLLDATSNANDGALFNFELTGAESNWLSGSPIEAGSTIPAAPSAEAQSFCGRSTVGDFNPAPSTTIQWYASEIDDNALSLETELTSGTYYVSESNANACESERTSVSITINEMPTVSFTAPDDVCVDAGIQSDLSGGSPEEMDFTKWVLNNITFNDGDTVTGSFVYNAATNTYSDWNIVVSGGNAANFPAITYTTANSEVRSESGSEVLHLFSNFRDLYLNFNSPLTADAGNVSLTNALDGRFGFGGRYSTGVGESVTGTAVSTSGVYSGPGVTDDANGATYSFDPETAGVGIHTITYTYVDLNGCSNTATDTFEVLDIIAIEPVSAVSSIGSYTLPAITGTNLSGNEAYYTEPNGGGTTFSEADILEYTDFSTYPVTLYMYDESIACSDEEIFELTIEPPVQEGLELANNSFIYDGTVKSLVVTGQATDATVVYENNGQANEGSYTVKATVTRPNYTTAVLEATLVINPRPITLTAQKQSKVYGNTFTLDGKAFTVKDIDGDNVLPNGESIDVVSFTSATGIDASTTADVGMYADDLIISSPTGSAGFDISNYIFTYDSGDFEITPATQTELIFADKSFTYDATAKSLVVTGQATDATVAYSNNDQTNAGIYEVAAEVTRPNYTTALLEATLTITKAEAVITADAIQAFTYDGNFKNVTASLNHNETTLIYTPQQGYTNAGNYPVTVSAIETDNYQAASKEVSLVIENAEIEGVTFEGETFTYDGTTKAIAVTGLPEGASVSYENNDKINSGTYTVTATVSQDNYNDKVLTADLVINKAQGIITADATQTFTYDDTPKNVTASLNHSETSLTYAPQQGYSDAGTYRVTTVSAETDNYLSASKEVTLVIENAEITGVTFEEDTFTYDGSTKTIEVIGLPEGASVSYENNDQTVAGTYEVTATVSQENYNDKILTADLVIEKAEATITAEATQTFTYDGIVKNVNATLNHSETSVTYAPQQGYTDAGTYGVAIASAETDNYLSASKEVTLVIENAEITGVTFEDDTFTYDGSTKTIKVSGLPEGASVSYENNDQTVAGTYEVTATVSQENYNDKTLTADLVIEKAEAVIAGEAIQTFTYDGTVKNVTATLNHSETALTYTPAQGYTDAGTYGVAITSAETDNYLSASNEVTLIIENAEITGVTFEDDTFIYDGTSKTIEVSDLPEGASVSYENNGKANAGNYKVTAIISKENYNELELNANMLIEKASQSITFNEIEALDQQTDEYLQLDATSTSGLPVMYSYTYETEDPAATVGSRGFIRILGGGQITITATQAGNQNYEAATPVVRTLTIIGSDARLNTAVINGTTYTNPSDEIYYLIGCGSSENEVRIEIEQNHGSTIDRDNIFTMSTPAPGIYKETVIVTSEDGNITRTYNLTVEKNFNFEDIVVQKFNNVLLVDNNPDTNGGYKFVSYRWYKDGSVIGNGQYYSAGNNADDQLDANSSYYVVLETEDGEFLRTCTSAIQLRSSLNVALAPNPVSSGGTMELFADFPKGELETMSLSIHNLNGMLIKQMKSNSKSTSIALPYNLEMGVYILKIETKNIRRSLKFIIK